MSKVVLKTFILLALFCVAFIANATETKAPESIQGTKRVTAEEVIELITQKDNLVVIDARKTSDRESAGWIEGSHPLPDYDTTPETLAKVVPSKSTPVLFYCNGVKCGRSVKSSKIAVKQGYKEVYWFRGGWEEWSNKGLPAEH